MTTFKAPRIAFYMRVSKGDKLCKPCDYKTKKREVIECPQCNGPLKEEQTIENQVQELMHLAAVEGWTEENITLFPDEGITGSVGREGRPQFDELLHRASRGHFDIVAAWSLDRLGREPKDVFELSALASRKGFTIYLHKDRIDTGTASGELFFTIMAGMAKFERRRLQERVHAGLDRARAQGKTLGRPKKNNPQLDQDVRTAAAEGMGKKAIAARYNCGVGTVYRILSEQATGG